MSTEKNKSSFFYLLQISDPLLPIGGYTQSYGLETYVQKGIVHDANTSKKYLESYLLNNFFYNELLAVKLSFEYAVSKNMKALIELDRLLSAIKFPKELRMASIKLGTRFSKIVESVLKDNAFFSSYLCNIQTGKMEGHYSCIYGLSAALFGADKTDTLSAIAYSTAASIINNCAKLVPISQQSGQKILLNLQPVFLKLLKDIETLDIENLGQCCFGFDLRSMQHERLYSRIYIS